MTDEYECIESKFSLRDFLKADIRRLDSFKGNGGYKPWRSYQWVSLLSPRIIPVFLCRLAYYFEQNRLGLLAKFISLLNFVVFGIEIATNTYIGEGLLLPHTHGTVIGAYSIGRNATIFQGVTLGARELNLNFSKSDRPMLGDDVMLGAGAKVLGGISIGNGAVIGANAVVINSVPDRCRAVGIPAQIFFLTEKK